MRGFAVLLHLADLNLCYLEFISTAPGAGGGGIGAVLYERVQEEAERLGAAGLFFESSVDDPALVADPRLLKANAAQTACAALPPGKSIYPIIFPLRNPQRPPKDLELRLGYYCMDTFTPLNRNAYLAARGAVDCALTAADALLDGYPFAYALVRPPGHHAERRAFGGFCYFNSAAVAAHFLSHYGRVAVLDVDFHHGNGTQDIFYERADVLTVSIHGDPRYAYPHFAGFADERGEGEGRGFNLNIPLAEQTTPERYRQALATALRAIRNFAPQHLVVSLGLDTAKADPTGTWPLRAEDFRRNGELIGALQVPTLVVQEGGYRTRTLGTNARHFFEGPVSADRGVKPASPEGEGDKVVESARSSVPETRTRRPSRP